MTLERVPARAPYHQTTFQIVGFDRMHFVGDVANAIPQHDQCRLTGLAFEANGVRVDGHLTVSVADERDLTAIGQRLRAVRGLVQVIQIN